MHNNDSFDSHAFFRFIGSSSLSGSLGASEYEVNADMFWASGFGQMSQASQLNHFSGSQLSVVHWRKPKVLSFGRVPTYVSVMEKHWICMTVILFSLWSWSKISGTKECN